MLMGSPIGSPPQGGRTRRVSTTRFKPWAKTVRWPRERMGSRKLPAPFTLRPARWKRVSSRSTTRRRLPSRWLTSRGASRRQSWAMSHFPSRRKRWYASWARSPSGSATSTMRVTVRRPGQSTQPVSRVRKRAEDGRPKRSVKRPSRRSQAMTGGSSGPAGVPAGDAEDIVSNECASVDWSWNNRSNGGASPSATAPLATSATGRIAPADHAPPFFQAPAAARQRPASGLDWLYRSATTSGALRRPETAKVHPLQRGRIRSPSTAEWTTRGGAASRSRERAGGRSVMRRLLCTAAALGLVLTGCYGDTDPPGDLTGTSATLRAWGVPQTDATVYYFKYGTTPQFGQETPRRFPTGLTPNTRYPIVEGVTGLAPATRYYYTVCGKEQSEDDSKFLCGNTQVFLTSFPATDYQQVTLAIGGAELGEQAMSIAVLPNRS